MIAPVLDLHVGARALAESVDQMRRDFAHLHDVRYGDAFLGRREAFRAHLFAIANDAADFRHFGKALRIDLRRATGDDDLRVRTFAAGAADGLARLAHGFASYGACVDDHSV